MSLMRIFTKHNTYIILYKYNDIYIYIDTYIDDVSWAASHQINPHVTVYFLLRIYTSQHCKKKGRQHSPLFPTNLSHPLTSPNLDTSHHNCGPQTNAQNLLLGGWIWNLSDKITMALWIAAKHVCGFQKTKTHSLVQHGSIILIFSWTFPLSHLSSRLAPRSYAGWSSSPCGLHPKECRITSPPIGQFVGHV